TSDLLLTISPKWSGTAEGAIETPIAIRSAIYEPGQAFADTESTENETVVYTLADAKRSLSLAYTAISYIWGDLFKPLRRIVCNGQAMYITSNCHTVPSSPRSLNIPGPSWIDTFRVNQKDVLERNTHVARMGEIFRDPSSTIVSPSEQEHEGVRAPVMSLPELKYAPGEAVDLRQIDAVVSDATDDGGVTWKQATGARKRLTALQPELSMRVRESIMG
ncbi:hypothetical protein LTR74_008893, partial [Friedmanniomyces endolithicus]